MDRYEAEEIEYRKEESDMNDYNRGKRDSMLEIADKDLVDVASRIAVLEDELEKERDKKWSLVNKITLLESGAAFECIDDNEKLSLYDKLELLKNGKVLT